MTRLAVGARFSQFLGGELPCADTEPAESSRKSTLGRARSVWMSLRELILSFVPEAERVVIGKYGNGCAVRAVTWLCIISGLERSAGVV